MHEGTGVDELVLSENELPAALRIWLEQQPELVVALERLSDGRVLLRPLPGISPAVVARVRVAMARYRETLMNLS